MALGETFGWQITSGLIASALCAVLAGRRGYCAWHYAGLGLIVGVGALPLTWLATAEPLGPNSVSQPGQGFSPAEPPRPVDAFRVADKDAAQDLAVWRDLYHSLRQGLYLGTVLVFSVLVSALLLLCCDIVPTFVALFEGMSLALPVPTQILITSTKALRNPHLAGLWLTLRLAAPAALYYGLTRARYGWPIFGRIWRHADQIWRLYALQAAGSDWPNQMPREVTRRLARSLETELPAPDCPLDRLIRRERDGLSSALWMIVPGLLPVLGILFIQMSWVLMAVFLPFYTTSGNIGG